MLIHRKCLLAAMLLAFSGPLLGSSCPAGNLIGDPASLAWTHHPASGGTEEYWSARLEIGEATLGIGGETITTRVYRVPGTTGTIPGPTLEVVPGRKYVLEFRNVLPYEPPVQQHNVFKDPNISNLHTHGLHISGESPGDDVTRSFEGGAGGDFVYDIPADHMGGTYWYHAHHHGSTYLQVSGGAFGMLLVDDRFDPIPDNVANMAERQLVIAYLDPAAAGTGGDTLISGTLSPTWTVNGKVNGDLCVPPNTWQHWRVLLADRDARPKTVTVGAACEVALMARDGVWRTEVPKPLTDNSLSLTGASRADLAVRCSGDAEISVGGTVVANVYADGTGDDTVHPFDADGASSWFSYRPHYLRDLRGEPVDNTETVNMGARTINGNKFDIEVPTFALDATGLQEWILKGARNHPFHLHIYHVQINGACGEFEDGEYYDVVANNCDIRFDLDSSHPDSSVYEGRTIMHCHILEHEDQGAMGWLDTLDPELPEGSGYIIGAPTFPAGTPYLAYHPPDTGSNPPSAPSGLAASAASTTRIDLAWTDNSGDETGFDVERSTDGQNFGFSDSVGADTTTYADTGLTAGTTYHYRVRAFSPNGSSGYSNLASDTTQSGGTASALEVASVTLEAVSVSKGFKFGRASVVVRNDLGEAVAGVTVTGEFSGDINTVELSDTTDASGSTVIDSTDDPATETVKGKLSLRFCVTGLSGPLPYEGGEVCNSL
ncbi:MAG: multicopper oxidase domain-containing protein [Xanthomonadales bacterium]|nr:multicopper oxidase domain-containing protein [Xanthomonadales bacterium]NIN58896.1 multicopper oxidase domain-containing protein [Xanthomonadales bacterium]NIN74165.1 multicopper oxidase domain-containing protein [Xanthomonadales bacterium]NIO13836.1 multicopper oxidase domain-containing protein [Xanthomonadales bacterium]NIP11289.1 multicopper oxidase domain-containing protein [Xanthomonadales bacterium]